MRQHVRTLVSVVLAGCAVAPGCASAKKHVEITSTPDRAEVVTQSGETLGVTPLTLEEQKLTQATHEGRLSIGLRHAGYAPKYLVMDLTGNDSHQVNLSKLDDSYFNQEAMPALTEKMNEMANELLRIQGLMLVRKNDEAEKHLTEFQKRYPNIVAGYVMRATLSLSKGDSLEALDYLARGRSVDPTDSELVRMLGTIKNGGGTP